MINRDFEQIKKLIEETFGASVQNIRHNKKWKAVRFTNVGLLLCLETRYQVPLDILSNPKAEIKKVDDYGNVRSVPDSFCEKAKEKLLKEASLFKELVKG